MTGLKHGQARIPIKTTVLGMAGVLVLAGSAVAQDPADATAEEATQSNRISVRIAEGLGNDPEAIYRFVADHVTYEPYSGLLRGDAGTYYSRAGNSVDQSVMLATLLGAADVDTRFAVGPLADGAEEQLLAAATLDEATLRERQASALYGRIEGLSEPPPELPAAGDYITADDEGPEADALADWMGAELDGGLATVSAALQEAGVTIEGAATALPADEVDLHTWIQASIGGDWVDLDPSLPTLSAGETIAVAAETLDEIPEERVHSVEIRVIGERLVDGTLEQVPLLALQSPAHELAGEPIIVGNLGSDAVPALTQAFEAVLGVESFHPVVAVGQQSVGGDRMQFGAGDDSGGLGGGFFDTGDAVEEATAEWLEVTLAAPGREPVTERRVLFDRVGHEARQAGAIDKDSLAPLVALDIDGDGREELTPLHSAMWLSVSTGLPSMRSPVLQLEDETVRSMSLIPFTHHVMTAMAGSDVGVPLGVRPYADAPNVTALWATASAGPAGEVVVETAVDILHRNLDVAPVAGVEQAALGAAVPGVLAHVTERLLAGEATGEADGISTVSVARVFDLAAEAGIATRTVASRDELADLPFTAGALDTLGSSLDRGLVAIVPEQPVNIDDEERVGWWLIDPASGRVRDQMDDGRAVTTEEIVMEVFLTIVGAAMAKLAQEIWVDINQPMADEHQTVMDQVTF